MSQCLLLKRIIPVERREQLYQQEKKKLSSLRSTLTKGKTAVFSLIDALISFNVEDNRQTPGDLTYHTY